MSIEIWLKLLETREKFHTAQAYPSTKISNPIGILGVIRIESAFRNCVFALFVLITIVSVLRSMTMIFYHMMDPFFENDSHRRTHTTLSGIYSRWITSTLCCTCVSFKLTEATKNSSQVVKRNASPTRDHFSLSFI